MQASPCQGVKVSSEQILSIFARADVSFASGSETLEPVDDPVDNRNDLSVLFPLDRFVDELVRMNLTDHVGNDEAGELHVLGTLCLRKWLPLGFLNARINVLFNDPFNKFILNVSLLVQLKDLLCLLNLLLRCFVDLSFLRRQVL